MHKSSPAALKREYENFLEQSCALLSTDQEFHVVGKNRQNFSHQTLQKIEDEIVSIVESSLNLLIKLLKPVIKKLKTINSDIDAIIAHKEGVAP